MRVQDKKNRHILVVDNDDDILEMVCMLATKAGYQARQANSGVSALKAIAADPPDLILLDIKMPDMDGYEVCRRLKAEPATEPIPVIFISGLNVSEEKVKGFNLGAVDYISKPFNGPEVLARVKTHLDLYQFKTRLEHAVADRTAVLVQERARLRCVIDAIPDLISFEDRQGDVFGCNKAFETFAGCKQRPPSNQTSNCLNCEEGKHLFDKTSGELSKQSLKNERAWITSKDGGKALLDTLRTPFWGPNNMPLGWVTISRDITAQVAAREEHQKLSRRLKQAQKLEAIGTLAGGIAHDFNNILSSVIGFTELAEEDAPEGSMLEDNLNEVLQAGLRAKELVSQILTFARQSDEKIKPVRVSLIAKETSKLLKATLPTTIQIQNDLRSEALVMCDPTQIHQVFMNLCTNASHAMEKNGGYLTITLNDTEISGAIADKHHLSPGHYLELRISDTGTGIAAEHLDKIFEPYFTTKPQGEGTGLGLAVVHGIVTGCDGAIDVDSHIGKGTTFTLYFPKARQTKPVVDSKPKNLPRGNEKILVVDDEAGITKVNSQVLQRHGYSVATCTNSLAALELFRSDPHHFDLLLTDMTMPGISGDGLSREIRNLQPDIPIIICTGYAKKLSHQRAKEIGINALIMKPLSKNTLLYTVRKVLDQRLERLSLH